MNSTPEQSPSIRRIERRWRIFDWITGTTLLVAGTATLLILFTAPSWAIHHPDHSRYGTAAALAAALVSLWYGVVTLKRLLKSKRRKFSPNK
jgi:hypothetical protein